MIVLSGSPSEALPTEINGSLQSRAALDAYQSGNDLRPFILQAIATPDHGAAFYAIRAVEECDALTNMSDVSLMPQAEVSASGDAVETLRRISAFNYFKNRCANLLSSESNEWVERLRASALAASEPIYAASRRFSKGLSKGDTAARKSAVEAIVATADPLVIDGIGIRIGLYGGQSGAGPQFQFRGHPYDLRTESDIMAAVSLLPCGLGLRCDEKEGSVGRHCADGGACYASRFDELENTIFEGDPDRYQRMLELYRQLLASIKRNSAEDFLK
jgi:hypothetical protein